VQLEGAIESLFGHVEGVGILHQEFARAEHAGLGTGLVAELGLELVPDLRQLPVGTKFGGDRGEDLLVGRAETEIGAVAVAQPEELLPDQIPAAGLLPELRGMKGGEREFLGADPIHLLADDPLDLGRHAEPEGQKRVGARHELANEASAEQELVARRLGVGRILSQRGDESSRPAHRGPPSGERQKLACFSHRVA
jgi:hypothetical protein